MDKQKYVVVETEGEKRLIENVSRAQFKTWKLFHDADGNSRYLPRHAAQCGIFEDGNTIWM